MNTTYKFTISAKDCNKVYAKDRVRNICQVRKAHYPFEEVSDNTVLYTVSAPDLAMILIEDNINFTLESYDVDLQNTITEYTELKAMYRDLSAKYEELSRLHGLLTTYMLFSQPKVLEYIKQLANPK